MKAEELGIPEGPPWEVDVVADVHAGVYPAELTADLLRKMAADPDAAAVLAALDSTVDDLSLLPEITMPRQYAQRLDDVIAAEFAALDTARADASAPAAPPARPTSTDVVRGQFGALLAQGNAPAAPPGLSRPNAPATGGSGPALPRQSGSAPTGPAHPLPRRQPVIPRVLPTAPRSTDRPAPAAAPASNVHSLPAARQDRPAAGRPPAGSGATGPRTAKPNGPTRVGSLEAQRAKRRRWTGGLLAAAAVGALAVGITFAVNGGNSGSEIAGDAEPSMPTSAPGNAAPHNSAGGLNAFVLEPGKFGDKLAEIEQGAATGSLANPAVQAACLNANNIEPGKVTGVSEVTFRDQPAYAIAVDLDANTVEVVVVGTGCGVDGEAATLDRETVTR